MTRIGPRARRAGHCVEGALFRVWDADRAGLDDLARELAAAERLVLAARGHLRFHAVGGPGGDPDFPPGRRGPSTRGRAQR